MINRYLFTALLAGSLLTTPMLLQAASAKAKFLMTPTTTTHFNITNYDNVRVQYTVLNQTKLIRTLTMTPIQGLNQITTGNNTCANPFTLKPNESCELTLEVIPTPTAFNITGGPEVCKTKGLNNNSPDPFLCSQPAVNNRLSILRQASPFTRELSASPTQLSLGTNESGQITITNHSFLVTATNIQADLSRTALEEGNVTQDSSNCLSLAPLQSCTLTFTAGETPISLASFPIKGNNTRATSGSIEVTGAEAMITVIGSPVVFVSGQQQGTLTIKNESTQQHAVNITVTSLPPGVTSDNTNCADVAADDTCTLTLESTGEEVSLSTIFIKGDNTSLTSAELVVNGASQTTIEITEGSPMTLTAEGSNSTIQTMTIKNTGAITATNITVPNFPSPLAGAVELVSSTCQSVEPDQSCQLGFQANTTQAATTNFVIQGEDTTAAVGTITVNPVNYAYIGNSNSISRCNLTASTGNVSNCSVIASGQMGPRGTVLNSSNSYLYTYNASNTVSACAVEQVTGGLNCTNDIPTGITGNTQGVAINPANTLLYPAGNRNQIFMCPIISNGSSISSCTDSGAEDLPLLEQITINPDGTKIYVVSLNSGVYRCDVDPGTGRLSGCVTTGATALPPAARGIAISSDNLYAYITGTNAITGCAVDGNGDFTNCSLLSLSTGIIAQGADIKLDSTNTYAYVTTNFANPYYAKCNVLNGVVSSCATIVPTSAGVVSFSTALLQ